MESPLPQTKHILKVSILPIIFSFLEFLFSYIKYRCIIASSHFFKIQKQEIFCCLLLPLFSLLHSFLPLLNFLILSPSLFPSVSFLATDAFFFPSTYYHQPKTMFPYLFHKVLDDASLEMLTCDSPSCLLLIFLLFQKAAYLVILTFLYT